MAVVRLFTLISIVFACFVSQQPPLFLAGALLCSGFMLLELGRERWSPTRVLQMTCLALLFLPAFLKPAIGLVPVFYAFSTMAVLLAAWALARHPPAVLVRVFRWIYVICIAGICVGLVAHAGETEALGKLLPNTSVNGIPSYMLVLQVGVSLSFFAHHGRLPMLSPWITGWIAFMGIGRGSIIVAGLIIGATLAFNLRGQNTRWSAYLFRVLMVVCVAAMAFATGPEAYDWISSHTKLSAGLIDTHRADILSAYWSQIDPVSLVIGADFTGTIIDELYHGNPHVAFLRTHSFFGLPLTVLALLSPLAVWWAPIPRNRQWVYMTFCALLVLRATTEPILFPTLLDLIYFTVLFLPFRRDTISPQPANRTTHMPPMLANTLSHATAGQTLPTQPAP